MSFDGFCWVVGRNNQPKVDLIIGIMLWETAHREMVIEEDAFATFRPLNYRAKKEIYRNSSWLLADDVTQKKLNSREADGKGLGEVARPAGNAGERYLIVLGAIKVGGGRK